MMLFNFVLLLNLCKVKVLHVKVIHVKGIHVQFIFFLLWMFVDV